MKIISVRNFSILGLVLIAASAIAAAILPEKERSVSGKFVRNGTLTPSATNLQHVTCKPTLVTIKTCHDTISAVNSVGTGETEYATNPTISNDTTIGDMG